MAVRQGIEPQDQNNPKQKYINLQSKSAKDIKQNKNEAPEPRQPPQMSGNQVRASGSSKVICEFPRIDSQNYDNPQKMQVDYHHLMQDIEKMKQQFLNDHTSMIK